MKRFTHCNNCGSDDIEWMSTHQSDSGVQDGRLRTHDIKTVYFLACHNCSETLQFMNEDLALTLINGAYFK